MLLLIHQNVRMLCCCNLIWLNHFVPIPKQRYLLLSILNIILETILIVYGFPLCPFNPAPFHPNIGLENCHEIERKITEFNNDSDLHSADMKTFKEAFEKKYWYGYYTELRKSIFAKPADLATDALGLVTVIEPNQLPGLTAVLNYDLEKKKTAAALEEKRLVTNADTAALKIEAKKEVRLRTVEAKQQTDLATIAAPMPTMVAGAPAAASPAMMLPSASRLDHVSPSNQHSSASNSNVPTVLVSSDGESTNNLLEDGEVIDDGGGSKKRARELENSSFVELSDKDTDDSDPTSIKSPKKKMPKTHHGQPSPINTSNDAMACPSIPPTNTGQLKERRRSCNFSRISSKAASRNKNRDRRRSTGGRISTHRPSLHHYTNQFKEVHSVDNVDDYFGHRRYILIIDTNALIHGEIHMREIFDYISLLDRTGTMLRIIIPLTTIRELDYLKKNNPGCAQTAARWLEDFFELDNPSKPIQQPPNEMTWIRIQSEVEFERSMSGQDVFPTNNDEKIVACGRANLGKGFDVVIITSDRICGLFAYGNGIYKFTPKGFVTFLVRCERADIIPETMKAKTLNQQQQQRIVKLEHLLDTRSGQIESLTSLRRDDLSRLNDHESALRAILRDCSKRGENLPRGWALEWSGPHGRNYFTCEESNISIWY